MAVGRGSGMQQTGSLSFSAPLPSAGNKQRRGLNERKGGADGRGHPSRLRSRPVRNWLASAHSLPIPSRQAPPTRRPPGVAGWDGGTPGSILPRRPTSSLTDEESGSHQTGGPSGRKDAGERVRRGAKSRAGRSRLARLSSLSPPPPRGFRSLPLLPVDPSVWRIPPSVPTRKWESVGKREGPWRRTGTVQGDDGAARGEA